MISTMTKMTSAGKRYFHARNCFFARAALKSVMAMSPAMMAKKPAANWAIP